MKNHTTWLKAAIVLQLLTAVIHGVGLFSDLMPSNDTERQMISLMDTYLMDLGAGYHRSMSELFFALSSCFSLLCLLGGLVNWALIRQKADLSVMKAITNISVVIFGITFAIMAMFTFLPPIVLTGMIFVSLLACRLAMPRH